MYEFLTPKEHMITIRNRETNFAKQSRYWREDTIHKILKNQKDDEDVFVSKYPKSRLLSYIILDFDGDRTQCFKEVTRLKNDMYRKGHNCVIVDSTNKGYHIYIQIAPFLFADTELRTHPNWDKYFKEFVKYFICHRDYQTLDSVNFNAGLNGNIRLIGSVHPSTGKVVRIIDGEFKDLQVPTYHQDKAQKVAWGKYEIAQEKIELRKSKTQLVNGNDPIADNDLRILFPQIFGGEIKHYEKGYAFMKCPFHNDEHPSLLITKEFYSCAGCGEKGNIFTLYKKGLVKFNDKGGVIF